MESDRVEAKIAGTKGEEGGGENCQNNAGNHAEKDSDDDDDAEANYDYSETHNYDYSSAKSNATADHADTINA